MHTVTCQQRHTGNTHHNNDNIHCQHDHNHNNAKEERRSSSRKKKEGKSLCEMSLHIMQKNARCLNNGDRFDELLKELEGCNWDATLETRKKDTWESRGGHMHMGAGGFAQKHGVGILLNERWKRKIIKTGYVSERLITAAIKCHQRRIELTSVYFSHSGYADVHMEKMYRTTATKKHTTIIPGDFSAQHGLGTDSECDHVGKHTT